MPLQTPRMTERFASKTLLYTEDGGIVCVVGKRPAVGENPIGWFSLVGGGVDPGESAIEALYREVNEELGITPNDMTLPKEIGGTWADLPRSKNEMVRRTWHVHEATLLVPSQTLRPRAELTSVHVFSPEALLAHDRVSILAKQSLALSLDIQR